MEGKPEREEEEGEGEKKVVPMPEYLDEWLFKLKPEDVACNAHKITEDQWFKLKEQAANLWYTRTPEEKNELMALSCVNMTPDEMFREKVDENREAWRIAQAMCMAERTKGKRNHAPISLHGPNGIVQSWTIEENTGIPVPLIKTCAICQKACNTRCVKCKSFYYCCKEHQAQHWKGGHRNECASFAATFGTEEK